ncbi:MAG: L-threonylcarbamoyladenylate synthase [Bacteroidales bacterium]|nr:L-threonylcarbamoyladenylate synthase [Bacteroidales bacterium]
MVKETKRYTPDELSDAAKVIHNSGLIAFPTETVYGLGADATSETASRKIYLAKGRPSDNPFIVHVCDIEAIEEVAYLCPISKKIFETFSPGPITVVLKKKSIICDTATAGLDSVGVRIPSHPVAREFLKACGIPVAAPSANISGKLSPTTADMVLRDLNGRIDGIIESDDIECGLESTVVGVFDGEVKLFRTGSISIEQLEECLGQKITVSDRVNENEAPQSPGQKHKHYQPEIPLTLVEQVSEISPAGGRKGSGIGTDYKSAPAEIKTAGADLQSVPCQRIGVMTLQNFDAPEHWDVRLFKDTADYAQNLYRTMHEMAQNGCVRIIAVLPPDTGVGRAIRNRLMRAAS